MHRELFGRMPGGAPIELYLLENKWLQAKLMPYGAGIVSLRAPDRTGHLEEVVLGFRTLDGYIRNHRSPSPLFFGSTVGRYANRIAGGRFRLDGHEYNLATNNGANCLHGGPGGFYNVVWDAVGIADGVEFRYLSNDGEEGFPGRLQTAVRFTLDGTDLKMQYEASTDKATVINLTNHAYFNLAGAGHGSILSHQLKLSASRFTVVDSDMVPTGELRTVEGTPLDFRRPVAIGERIHAPNQQLELAKGYDHNFVLDGNPAALNLAAELYDPSSGRVLQVLTTEPAVQFYSGNYLDGSAGGRNNEPYGQHGGLCLETQHFPDSPNHPNFPSTVLRPGEKFQSATIYRFSVR